MHRTIPLAVVATLSAPAPAQIAHLVGISHVTSSLEHRDMAACTMLSTCAAAGLGPTTPIPLGGGTGWDPILVGAWISNGTQIACVDDNCNYLCPITNVPTPFPITGLECVESLNELWATDTQGNLHRMTRSCPPVLIWSGNTGIATSTMRGLTGLAVDEGHQLVFWSEADFLNNTSLVHVATMANPTVPFFTHNVANWVIPCGFRQVTGLAVDWGNRLIFLTDGVHTIVTYYWLPPGFSFGIAVNCCMLATNEILAGLAWRPSVAVPFGSPCSNGTCPSCPMVHTTANDSNLGNAQFALRLSGAPANSLAWFHLTWGVCGLPGINFPVLCGLLWTTTNTLGTSVPFPTGSGPPCGGIAQYNLPLPTWPALAGASVASQCIVLCPGPGFNTSLSNCLTWTLQGN